MFPQAVARNPEDEPRRNESQARDDSHENGLDRPTVLVPTLLFREFPTDVGEERLEIQLLVYAQRDE